MTPEAMAALHAAAMAHAPPWSADAFAETLARPECFAIGDAAGLVLGRVVLDEAELLTLAVAPDLQGQGRGRALLAGFEAEARARGAADAFLEVAADNAAARALYAGAGWALRGRRPGYYPRARSRPADALILRKALHGARPAAS